MFRHEGETLSENSTWTATSGVALLCLVAGCSMGADPDPRTSAVREPRTVDRGHDGAPVLVVAPLASLIPAPAPLGEARRATPPPPPVRPFVVAVGQNVAHIVDKNLEVAFAGDGGPSRAQFNGLVDRDAVDALLMARADFGVIGGQLSARETYAGLQQTQLGVELFALAVAPDSPLQSVSPAQMRQIFTGQVTEWRQLGLPGGAIVPVVPADPAIAERAARTLIPGDDFVASATRVATLRHVADQTLRHPGAIGIVRVTDEPAENGIKLLQIDWTAPTFDAFCYGTYRYGVPMQLVTSGAPAGEARRFLDFARSEAGRSLLGRALRTR